MVFIGSSIVVGLLWWAGGEPLRAVTAPEVRDAPQPFSAERRAGFGGRGGTPGERREGADRQLRAAG
jgi:hypothetical protein